MFNIGKLFKIKGIRFFRLLKRDYDENRSFSDCFEDDESYLDLVIVYLMLLLNESFVMFSYFFLRLNYLFVNCCVYDVGKRVLVFVMFG